MNIRLGRVAAAAIVLYLLLSAGYISYHSIDEVLHYPSSDFTVFYGGAKAVLSSDRQWMYVADFMAWTRLGINPTAALNGFFYPPIVGWILLPLTLFSQHTARQIYAGVSLVAALGLLYEVYLLTHKDRIYLGISLVVLLSCWAAYLSVLIGQSGLIFASLSGLALLQIERDREGSAGWFVALLVLKPMFFIGPLCLLAWRRRWQSLGLAIGLAAILILVPFLRLGFEAFKDYRTATSMVTSAGFSFKGINAAVGARYMLSWNGFIASVAHVSPSYWIVLPLDALTVMVALKAMVSGTLREGWLALTAAAVLTSPHILAYDWLVLLPAVIAVMQERQTGMLIVLALLVHLGVNESIYVLPFVWHHPPPSLPGGYWAVPPLALMLVYIAFRNGIDERMAALLGSRSGAAAAPSITRLSTAGQVD